MKKVYSVFIFLFFTVISIPILTMNYKSNQVSIIDNRKLQEFPKLECSSVFFEDFETYISDRIGFRTEMINFYTGLNDKLFNVMIHPSYIYGKGDYVFPKIEPENKHYDFIEDFADFISKIENYCNERDVIFLYCLNPSKVTVYNEYLPEGVNLKNERIRFLLKCLDNNNVRYIYTAPELIKAKENVQVYNVKYDAGHWNDNGAYIGISSILEDLNKDFPQIKSNSISQYNIDKELKKTLPVSYFPINEKIDVYTPKNSLAKKDRTFDSEIKINKSYNFFSRYINPQKVNSPKILVFRGSYFNGKEKFFVDNFSEVTLVHNYHNIINFDYYFNIFKPDIVLFESAEYVLSDKYFPQKEMNKAKFNQMYLNFKDLPLKNFVNIADFNQIPCLNKNNSLTDISLNLVGDNISCAYAFVNNKYYDFKVINSKIGQRIETTVNNEDLINSNNNVDIFLISEKKDFQNVITITLENE